MAQENRNLYIIPLDEEDTKTKRAQALRRKQRIYRRKRKIFFFKLVISTLFLTTALIFGFFIYRLAFRTEPAAAKKLNFAQETEIIPVMATPEETIQGISAAVFDRHPQWEEAFLSISDYARPGTPVRQVKNIFVHYTANPGTSAAQNRSYFEHLKDTHETSASSHFIIGYQGEIIQCIPLGEMAYAVQTRNEDSLSIECCYLEADGSFTPETYASLIRLLDWLTEAYDLNEEDILRHYDCGGKKCPLYYTEHEDAWVRLKKDVGEA